MINMPATPNSPFYGVKVPMRVDRYRGPRRVPDRGLFLFAYLAIAARRAERGICSIEWSMAVLTGKETFQ